jgi:hypothetical protein
MHLRRLGLVECFQTILAADDYRQAKPHRAVSQNAWPSATGGGGRRAAETPWSSGFVQRRGPPPAPPGCGPGPRGPLPRNGCAVCFAYRPDSLDLYL